MNDKQHENHFDEAFGLLADDIGVSDAKIIGVYGALARGLSKEEALKNMPFPKKNTMQTWKES